MLILKVEKYIKNIILIYFQVKNILKASSTIISITIYIYNREYGILTFIY